MSRTPLPNRRVSLKQQLQHGNFVFTLDVGFLPTTGRPMECFTDGPKEGSDMRALLSDISIVISLALQHGVTPEALAHSLGSVPAWSPEGTVEKPASMVGTIVEHLIALERELAEKAA